MIKDRLVYIIPVIVSLVMTIGLVRMVPLLSTKYLIKEIRHDRLTKDDYWYYSDLDGDGKSERVSLNYNPAGNVAVSVREAEDRIINQFNLPGQFLTLGSVLDIYDINSDGRLDILVCTRQHDSLFLSVIDDLYSHPTTKRVIFIDRLNQMNDYGDYLILPGYMSDLTGDGYPEYIFAVNGGHSLQPRRVYSVDLRNGKVTGSPLSGAAVWGLDLFDIDHDGIDEIFLNTVATENFKTRIPYPDSVSWMMVLNEDLQFYKPPHKMNPAPSKIYMEPFVFNDEHFLMVYHKYDGTGHYPSELSIYNHDLQIVRSRSFTQSDTRPYSIWRIPGRFDLSDIKIFTGDLAYTVDFDLEFTKCMEGIEWFDDDFEKTHLELDRDGTKELVVIGDHRLVVFDEEFVKNAAVDLEWEERRSRILVSLIEAPGKKPVLFAQFGRDAYTLDYSRNGWYHYRLLVYPSIFLALFLLFCLIVVIQKGIIERKFEKDRLISRLQMQAIRNQLDPHFTFNALNAVGSLIYKEKKELAYNYLKGLTDLLRMVSGNSSEITWRLEDELGFIRKYLEIEKLRFREKFSYLIDVSSENHYKSKVPKLSILTFVENAIKHGLRYKQGIRRLEIAVSGDEKKLMIRIEDNGIGRTAAAEKAEESGGSGIEIMEAYFRQFNEVTGKKSRFLIRDLYDDSQNASGTLVEIVIE